MKETADVAQARAETSDRPHLRSWRFVLLLPLILVVVACGGGGDPGDPGHSTSAPPPAASAIPNDLVGQWNTTLTYVPAYYTGVVPNNDFLGSLGIAVRRLELSVEPERHLAAQARAPEQVTALAEDGIFFGLVGFGRGYVSLSYLARMPFRRGELPRLHLDTEAGLAALHLMFTEIRLLQSLRMRTTAVDVASAAERQLLVGMGCDEARGPFFYGVMDAAETRQWSRGGQAPST